MARRRKQGTARTQQAMLPPPVEDHVGPESAARAIDAFVGNDRRGGKNRGQTTVSGLYR